MKLTCVAIDDEFLALEVLKTYIAKFPSLDLVATFDDAISAAEFLKQHPVDLLFVDVQMPDITGLELVYALQYKPMVIFTTAHKQYAYEGFELDALDYLLKPVDPERFAKAISKALEYYAYKNAIPSQYGESIFVHSQYKMVKIDLDEIEYIESLNDYLLIHTGADKSIQTLMTLKKISGKLPDELFKRIHRSFIISLPKVVAMQNKKVQMASGRELPISDSYYEDFLQSWKK